jgi:hypothetical protein
MPDIKTRDVVKGTVKTLDRAAIAGERMKDAYIRTREKAEQGVSSKESSPAEYAADRLTGSVGAGGYEAARQFDKQGRKAVTDTRENIARGKKYLERRKAEKVKAQSPGDAAQSANPTPQQQAKRYAKKQTEKSIQIKTRQRHGEAISHAADSSVKAAGQGAKTIRSTGKTAVKTAKGSVKTAQKTVKTARQTARTTVKTAETTVRAAQKSAQAAAKASKTAARIMWASWRNARTASSTPLRAIPATAAARSSIPWGTMKSLGMVSSPTEIRSI